jgi:hypothetical protein
MRLSLSKWMLFCTIAALPFVWLRYECNAYNKQASAVTTLKSIQTEHSWVLVSWTSKRPAWSTWFPCASDHYDIEFIIYFGPPSSESLIALKDLRHVNGIGFAKGGYLRDDHLRLLAASQIKVDYLDCSDQHQLTDDGIWQLREMRCLRVLNLADVPITDDSLRTIASLGQLERLELNSTHITDRGIVRLRDLVNLRELNLGRTSVTDFGVSWLATLSRLERLDLANTKTRGAWLQCAELPCLLNLSLNGCQLDEPGCFSALARHRSIERLDLAGANVQDGDIRCLAFLPHLKYLDLSRDKISDASIVDLTSFGSLESLNLSGTDITPAGAAKIARGLGTKCDVIY